MSWNVELTEWMEEHWETLSEQEQIKLDASIRLLEHYGPNLPFPHSSGVGAKFSHMRELRVQIKGAPYRYFYAFDPNRSAIVLCGGSKKGQKRFYEEQVALAEKLYQEHLAAVSRNK
ncbi:type II toxin-antitoxin system RelE/ParE family toxin [bacterium]|nr:type II toxin-antitoxin system RelE/ParE family toxin [bacterium]